MAEKLPPPVPKFDRRLIGHWKSDARRTLAEWRWGEKPTPKRRQVVRWIFGKLVLTYKRNEVVSELKGDRWSRRYKVLGADETSVAILVFGRMKGGQFMDHFLLDEFLKPKIYHIHFIERGYWISLGCNREFFRRLSRSATAKARSRK